MARPAGGRRQTLPHLQAPYDQAAAAPLAALAQRKPTDRQGDDPREHRFILSPASDPLPREVLTEPEEKTAEFVEMFKACFLAEPTPAMHTLKELHDAGHMVGPVITNNFDVLAARAGLDECFMRRYDQAVPDVEWVDGARALLVVGLHADRRKVQARARERGMTVVYRRRTGCANSATCWRSTGVDLTCAMRAGPVVGASCAVPGRW